MFHYYRHEEVCTSTVDEGTSNKHHCHLCPKRFTRYDNLFLHMHKTHGNARPSYHCQDGCSKSFMSSFALLNHSCAETFCCDLCETKFKTFQGLNRHKCALKEHIKLTCVVCKKDFNYERSLKQHLRIYHSRKKYFKTTEKKVQLSEAAVIEMIKERNKMIKDTFHVYNCY